MKRKEQTYPDHCECDAKDRKSCAQNCKPILTTKAKEGKRYGRRIAKRS